MRFGFVLFCFVFVRASEVLFCYVGSLTEEYLTRVETCEVDGERKNEKRNRSTVGVCLGETKILFWLCLVEDDCNYEAYV